MPCSCRRARRRFASVGERSASVEATPQQTKTGAERASRVAFDPSLYRRVSVRRALPQLAFRPVTALYFALHRLHGIARNRVRNRQQDVARRRHDDWCVGLQTHGFSNRLWGPRHRPNRRSWFLRCRRALSSRLLSSQLARSRRCQPIGWPRYFCCFGNRPSAVSAYRTQRWRRVSRATSWALRT